MKVILKLTPSQRDALLTMAAESRELKWYPSTKNEPGSHALASGSLAKLDELELVEPGWYREHRFTGPDFYTITDKGLTAAARWSA